MRSPSSRPRKASTSVLMKVRSWLSEVLMQDQDPLGAVAQGAFPDATPLDMGMVPGGRGGGDAGAGALVDGEGSGNYGTLPNLANTQLGQLLSQSVPPRQQSNSFSNPPLSLPSEIKPNLTMAGMPTTSGCFLRLQCHSQVIEPLQIWVCHHHHPCLTWALVPLGL